jgi:hypothetical protein
MKGVRRIGVLVLGIALFGFAVGRIGPGRVHGELEAMSSAIVMIFALSLMRLYLADTVLVARAQARRNSIEQD